MDESTKKLLNETYKLSQENNEYLKKIDRRQRYNMYWRIFLLIIAVGSALGVYYILQPYIEQIMNVYGEFEKSFIQFSAIPDQLKGMIKQ